MSKPNIGIMFRREYLPENLPKFAQKAESVGFDELWAVEDCFYAGGFAQAAVALASTRSIRVGLGIVPAVTRNAAFTAMEIATLSRVFPGRFLPGIGHGVREWMQQIGALPTSQLRALEEHTIAVRAILRGENVTTTGDYVRLEDVQLTHRLSQIPPVSLGVRGPRSLRLSGRIADGTIMAEGASPAYVRWAKQQIEMGRNDAQRTDRHRVTVYVLWSMDTDTKLARRRVRHAAARFLTKGNEVYSDALGVTADVQKMIATGGHDSVAEDMPDEWLHQLAVVGSLNDCIEAIQAFAEAGADSVVLVPQVGSEEALSNVTANLLKLDA